jgi:hypothetical protein
LRLKISVWVAPLIAPSVDLSVLGLVLGVHHLALHGASPEQLRPARRLLMFCSAATLALNVADPLVNGQFGTAAVDAVGPVLLIGWAEVSPSLLAAIASVTSSTRPDSTPVPMPSAGSEPDGLQDYETVVAEETGRGAFPCQMRISWSVLGGRIGGIAKPICGRSRRRPCADICG